MIIKITEFIIYYNNFLRLSEFIVNNGRNMFNFNIFPLDKKRAIE